MPVVERTAVLYVSNWFRRLWTLQEGALAKKVYFRFRDGTEEATAYDDSFQSARWSDSQVLAATYRMSTNFLTILSNDSEEEASDEGKEGGWEGEGSEGSWESADDGAGDDESSDDNDGWSSTSEDSTWNATVGIEPGYYSIYFDQLHRRATTRAGDETICVATVLNLDNRPLFQTEDSETRMELLASIMHRHDRSVIFNTFPRLQKEGFRWLPSSYMGLACRDSPAECHTKFVKFVQGKGLMVRLPGIMLGKMDQNIGEKLVMSTGDNNRVKFRVWKPDDEVQWPERWDPNTEYVLLTHKEYHIFGDDRQTEANSRSKIKDQGTNMIYRAHFEQEVDAIIGVKTGEDEDGRITMVHVCRALMWPGLRKSNLKEDLPPRDWLLEDTGADARSSLPEMKNLKILDKQLWCIR
ncbi:hypothetical protein ABW20_dc0100944 [Dactylellina cionopaga]|nr:hypothetical protein ABW20_dc0100944 [Dactylellina cionopaga]